MSRQIPQGIEVLVLKAAVDPDFKQLLLQRRTAAAAAIGLELTAAEATMLAAVPAAHSRRSSPGPPCRRSTAGRSWGKRPRPCWRRWGQARPAPVHGLCKASAGHAIRPAQTKTVEAVRDRCRASQVIISSGRASRLKATRRPRKRASDSQAFSQGPEGEARHTWTRSARTSKRSSRSRSPRRTSRRSASWPMDRARRKGGGPSPPRAACPRLRPTAPAAMPPAAGN